MKVEDNWSSVDAVLDSFNNVSIMPNARRRNDDIFASPSPPKHRISPSQLELLESTMGIRPQPQTVLPTSRGRGRTLSMIKDKISPQDRDMALFNDIRSAKVTNYSNAVIEDFYKNNCNTSTKEQEAAEDQDFEGSSVESSTDNKSLDLDQISVNSNLNVDAEAFYPPGMDPVNISKSLSFELPEMSSSQATFPRVDKSKYRNGRISNDTYNDDSLYRKTDCHIGFGSAAYETDDDDDDDDGAEVAALKTRDDSSPPSSSSSSLQINYPPEKEEEAPLEVVVQSEVKKTEEPKPRQKRVMKNALFMSLTQKQQPLQEPSKIKRQSPQQCPQLLRPMDLTSSFTSDNSAFHSVQGTSRSYDAVNDSPQYLAKPYDFMYDPTIDPETKNLLISLTSSSSSSSEISSPSNCSESKLSQTVKASTKLSSRSSTKSSTKSPSIPKPLSHYDYNYQESEFPPL